MNQFSQKEKPRHSIQPRAQDVECYAFGGSNLSKTFASSYYHQVVGSAISLTSNLLPSHIPSGLAGILIRQRLNSSPLLGMILLAAEPWWWHDANKGQSHVSYNLLLNVTRVAWLSNKAIDNLLSGFLGGFRGGLLGALSHCLVSSTLST